MLIENNSIVLILKNVENNEKNKSYSMFQIFVITCVFKSGVNFYNLEYINTLSNKSS